MFFRNKKLDFISKTFLVGGTRVDILKDNNFRIKTKNKFDADRIAKYIKNEDLLKI